MVEETFVRTGRIWVLRIDGRDIRTTGELPFYARGKGWTAVAELDTTDELLGEDGRWLAIEALEDTGEYETVYNFRVADWHTYFIGGDGWTWGVWTHNLCTNLVHDAATGNTTLELVNKFASNTPEYRQLVRFVKAWNSQITKLGGSMTRRTESSIEKLASAVWKKAMRKAYPKRFAGKVVGHTPDAAAGGPSSPTTANGIHIKAMALRKSVNAYLGGILSGIPVGTTYHTVKLV